MEEKDYIEMNIADTIMERPYGFQVGNRQYYLYPVTLGKTFLISRIVKELDADEKNMSINPYLEAMRLCRNKKDLICRLLSYHTFNLKEELFNTKLVEKRTKFFIDNLSENDIAQLFIIISTSDTIDVYIKHLGIDKEKKDLEKVQAIKKGNSNTFTFGGKSIYGSLIDVACERYGWTMDYIVWGISYSNLRMLLADSITSIYLTDEEKKKVRISKNKSFINADDPASIEKLKALRWD